VLYAFVSRAQRAGAAEGRPRVAIELFPPPDGAAEPQELLDAIRGRVPPARAGRRRKRRC
jgi:hypothetical protein